MMLEHLRRMAHYNAWANTRLLDACARLDEAEYHYVQSELAHKRKEDDSAEQHLRRAADLAPAEVGSSSGSIPSSPSNS